MELSSIKIKKIWCDQPRSYFPNLMHLDVNGCWNMQHLLSLSMSKSLMNLQSLFVSECGMMESIFIETEASTMEIEESIFPKLKNINLRSMKRLKQIWAKFPLHSFGKLDALIVEGCNKLENVFPPYMVGRFRSLCNLKVTNCKSMKEIFDLKGCGKREAEDTSLQNVHVEALPKLEHVWNKDPEGILNFKNLEKIWIQECLNLKHIFPVSVATGLKKLEYLEVWNCDQLKEIVFSTGETINVRRVLFEFPKLTTVRFSKLSNLESFYGGTYELHCSSLNNLSVELCHKLELFREENANPERKPVFLPEKVIYNLKSMQIEPRDANFLKRYMGNYRMHKLEEFQLSRLVDTDILYFFLHRNPNLKSLLLSNCFFERLVPLRRVVNENWGVVPKLKSLKLINLPSLKTIGFEEDTILFRQLGCLILKECPCLNTIAPSSVSFTYLINLEVSNCNKLSCLMTPSTAKGLVQLTNLKVIQCESMKTIVSKQENKEQINFRQLKEIELLALRKLESFCSSNNCAFDFPSLEKFVVIACGNMKTFAFSEQVTTPVLQQILVRHGKEEKRCYWKGDLNATIRHMHKIWALDENKVAASHPYETLESSRLKTLKLTISASQTEAHAIPTVVFPSLKNLEELEVCSTNVKVIFDKMGTEMKGYTFPLKKLTLRDLPNLKHVWDPDKDREGILSFQNLQEVLVTNCNKLKSLFPTELAKRIEKLEKLEIRSCEMFQEIVEEKNATTEASEEFSFPRLTSLNLCMLPQLSYFYPGRFNLECPDLNHLEVSFCCNLETFQSQQEAQSSTSVNRQPLFSERKAIFILESLKLDWKNTMLLCNGKIPENMLHKLVELELDFDDVNQASKFPVELLKKVSKLEYLRISRCRGLEEFFPSQPEQGEIETDGHLKTLALFCKELQKLCVSSCPHLTTLAHSAVSFSNLKQLSINDCHGLKHLFTSLTATKLVHLEEMYIVRCESMEEILAEELHETTSQAIKFERLNMIVLDSLSSLLCFYSGKDTLRLSSLITVLVWKCPKMKNFSRGDIHAESFLGIQVSLDPKDDLLFHQDLNTTVKMIQRREFFEAVDEKCFPDIIEIRAALHSKVGQQNEWFRNLATLKLDKCTLPYAIPSTILPYLNKLGELEVRDSDKVKVIFDMNDTETLETAYQLKILTLEGLSGLTHVWEKNSQGILIFRNLQEVFVSDCENLQTLFPASLAKNLAMLEKLEIESCHKLQEIVKKEERAAANVTEKFVFPLLERLHLYDLPHVTYFYPQTFTLECPALNKLSVVDCHELELFQRCEGEGGVTPINRLSLISSLKVISNLKKLTLDWKQISALSLWFRSGQFTEGLKYLNKITLSFFKADKNEKPILPVEILQKTPNLIEVRIRHCNDPKIVLAENPKIGEDGMFGHFKILTLDNVCKLESIKSEDSLWLNTVCEKLHQLNFVRCPDLTTFAPSPSTVSFSCLKKVSISNCPALQYLFTSSAAVKLMNLEEITIEECESVKEIVAKEDDATSEVVKFERLNTIVLHSLSSLTCFYSGSDTLQLSSLIRVLICKCPNMKIFSRGVINAESFRGVQNSQDLNEDLLFHQDVNATLKEMLQRQEFFEALDENCFPANLELRAALRGTIGPQNRWLRNLVTLKLDKFILPYAIPSAILPQLNNLKELEVRDSVKVKVIFYMNDTEIMETASQLKKLTLHGLSKLTRVWEKNSHGVLIFPNLQEVYVRDCEELQTLFPASLAKNLKELEKLEIKSCHKLQGIVEMEEGTAANVTEKFVFSRLQKLELYELSQVTYFYPQTFTLECPALNKLSVLGCPKLELFQSAHPMGEGEGTSASINRQPLISNLKAIPILKELQLNWKHFSALSLRFRSGQFTEGFKCLELIYLSFFNADENEKPMWPIEILQKAPNLIDLSIANCNGSEILLAKSSKIGEDGMLGQLKILTLINVSTLQSMDSEDSSWLNTICEKIHKLKVGRCFHLTTLLQSTSTVSFSCLKELVISKCAELQYLFTSSAAKKFVNLENITVWECLSLKEIVAKEESEDEYENEMIFRKLKFLSLSSLPKFESFYPGSSILNFPSLETVKFSSCYSTKLFCLCDKVPPKFDVMINGGWVSKDAIMS